MTKKRGNGEGTISKRGDGTYFARYWVETPTGSKRKAIYGKKVGTRKDLAKRLAKAIADRDSGVVFDDKGLTVSAYLDRWLTDAMKGTVRESTYSRDEYLMNNHVKPTSLERVKLKNVNAITYSVSTARSSTEPRAPLGSPARPCRSSTTPYTRPSRRL